MAETTSSLCKFERRQLNVAYTTSSPELKMASAAKRSRSAVFSAEHVQVLELLEREGDSNDGMSSDEESVLDHLLLDSEEDSR